MYSIGSLISPEGYDWDNAPALEQHYDVNSNDFTDAPLETQSQVGPSSSLPVFSEGLETNQEHTVPSRRPRRQDLDWDRHKDELKMLYWTRTGNLKISLMS